MDGGMKICGNCGARIPEGATICGVCGCPADAQADFGEFNAFVNGNTEVNESAIEGHAEWGSAAVVRAGSAQREETKPASAPVQQPSVGMGAVRRETSKPASAAVQQPGVRQEAPVEGGKKGLKRNKNVAMFLGLFLGLFGALNFYEHKYFKGFLYLFALWMMTFAPIVDDGRKIVGILYVILWLYDTIVMLCRPSPEYYV